MKLVPFKGQTTIVAEDQDEYLDLPARRYDDPKGHLICCWSLTIKERLKLLFTGKLWHTILTFNNPVQPIAMSVDRPFKLIDCSYCTNGQNGNDTTGYSDCRECDGEGEIFE